MKKLFAMILCVVFIFTMPICAFAEEEAVETSEPGLSSENFEPNVSEKPDEGNGSGIVQGIINYIFRHPEEVAVLASILIAALFKVIERRKLNSTLTTTNNNAIAVAETSDTIATNATNAINTAVSAVCGFTENISELLLEVKANEEEKQKLAAALSEATQYLKISQAANIELANEVAELLVLANIPNSKKDELYSRHRAAVGAIADMAKKTEVTSDEAQKE